MKQVIWIAGVITVLGGGPFVSSAAAQDYSYGRGYDPACRKANSDQRTEGTVVGGVAGAVLGGAVSGRHEKTEGAILGGVAGALLGNSVARANDHPCPPGFAYAPPPPPPPPQPRYVGPPPGDFWYGAPEDIHERIDYLQRRVDADNRDGLLSPREYAHLTYQLDEVRRQEHEILERNGGRLYPAEREGLFHRLINISHRVELVERAD